MSALDSWKNRAEDRIARAIRWRADALEADPSLRNLIRPKPGVARPRKKSKEAPGLVTEGNPRKLPGHQQRFEWADAFYVSEVQSDTVFYESFSGNGALCNPRAVFDFLLADERFAHLSHVWALRDGESRIAFESEYSRFPNVITVTHGSTEYWNALSTSKYLFNNSTFPWKFSKRREQVYINTWHGTPVKTMGYDSNEGAFGAANIVRNFVQSDFLVSPNAHTTDVMYRTAYKMDEIFAGQILEYGYPRIDAQLDNSGVRTKMLDRLRSMGMDIPSEAPIVLYAPTWRGRDFQSVESSAKRFEELLGAFEDHFGSKVVLLLKVHQQVYEMERRNDSLTSHIVPNSIPTNELLAVTDTLVTDFSSIWVDFLASRKPLVFFTPDRTEYEDSRGTYFDERPGREVETLPELMDVLETVVPVRNGETSDTWMPSLTFDEMHEKFASLEDGHSTERLVEHVFLGKTAAGCRSVRGKELATGKIRILLYLGGMRRNGITTSGLNLVNNLDPERFDVSIWAPRPTKASDMDMYQRLPKHVRQFLRHDSHPLSRSQNDELQTYLNDGKIENHALTESLRVVFDAEWRRCFGESVFDYVIDFSGYAGFWSLILAQGPARRGRYVWAHNDLESDRRKVVDGKRPNDTALISQYKAYQFYDGLVSVSPDLSDVNARSLWPYVKPGGFYSVRNSLDLDRLKRTLDGGDFVDVAVSKDGRASVNEVLRALITNGKIKDIRDQMQSLVAEDRAFSETDVFHFVSVGRLAPEKNQERLLRAFAICRQVEPRVRLTLLGDGPLLADLRSLAEELCIADAVDFMGNQPEALSFMKRADLFVLSSDFEGQPMVFMEALSMGTPILTVDFPTVGSALPSGQGVVVGSTPEALAAGMISYVRGEVSVEVSFDPRDYNAEVLAEFERVIGVD